MTDWLALCVLGILLPATRQGKSSRGTPRLRNRQEPCMALRALHWEPARGSPVLTSHGRSRAAALDQCLRSSFGRCERWPATRNVARALSGVRAIKVRRDVVRGFAALWLFNSRRKAHFLLERCTVAFLMPNVRAKRATTAGRQARAGENVPRTARPGLVACRWRSA